MDDGRELLEGRTIAFKLTPGAPGSNQEEGTLKTIANIYQEGANLKRDSSVRDHGQYIPSGFNAGWSLYI